jgi:hypothetical protein
MKYYSVMFCHHLVFCLTMLIFSGTSHLLGGCKFETLSCTLDPLISSNTRHLNLSGDLQHDFWRLMLQSAPLVFWADGRSARWVLSLPLTKQVNYSNNSIFSTHHGEFHAVIMPML